MQYIYYKAKNSSEDLMFSSFILTVERSQNHSVFLFFKLFIQCFMEKVLLHNDNVFYFYCIFGFENAFT